MGNVTFGIPRKTALKLAKRLKIKVAVETGTWKGETTTWLAENFERVISIEGWQSRFDKTSNLLGNKYPNLELRFGDSRTELAKVLADIHEPALFWLDAHFCGGGAHQAYDIGDECPLREELLAINAHPIAPSHVILIDDARLFTAPPPYPHHPEQWPDMAEVEILLKHHARSIEIRDDVIWAVPYFHEILLHNLLAQSE